MTFTDANFYEIHPQQKMVGESSNSLRRGQLHLVVKKKFKKQKQKTLNQGLMANIGKFRIYPPFSLSRAKAPCPWEDHRCGKNPP